MKKNNQPILKEGNISYVFPFILITTCFALWGFANDITNPMVKVNPEKPDVPLNKNDAFQKVQKRRVQEKR